MLCATLGAQYEETSELRRDTNDAFYVLRIIKVRDQLPDSNIVADRILRQKRERDTLNARIKRDEELIKRMRKKNDVPKDDKKGNGNAPRSDEQPASTKPTAEPAKPKKKNR